MSDRKQFIADAAKEILASLVAGSGGRAYIDGDKVLVHRACGLAESLYDVLNEKGLVDPRKTYLTP